MKCPNCAGQMGLEDVRCPYCGTPNSMAVQHQSDMAHFRREYEATQQDVMEKTSFARRHASWLAILSALLVALVFGIILQVNAWDIGYSIRESSVTSKAAEDSAAMDSLLEQGDYGKFIGYYDSNNITLDYDNPYQGLRTAASAYVDILQYVAGINDADNWAFKPSQISNTCTYLAEDLNRIYLVEQQYSYDLDRYLPADKRGYLEDIRNRTAMIAKTYFGLTDRDIEDIPEISKKKLARLIEEGMTS